MWVKVVVVLDMGHFHREHVVSIFFDFEKAYDTTRKNGNITDLYETDRRRRLPLYSKRFIAKKICSGHWLLIRKCEFRRVAFNVTLSIVKINNNNSCMKMVLTILYFYMF